MSRFSFLLRLVLITATVFVLFMAWDPHPPRLLVTASDKLNHMLAFGTLTILACAAFPRMPLIRIGEHLSFLGALIEVVQALPILKRDCDIMDWVADTTMIVGVLFVVAAARSRRSAPA